MTVYQKDLYLNLYHLCKEVFMYLKCISSIISILISLFQLLILLQSPLWNRQTTGRIVDIQSNESNNFVTIEYICDGRYIKFKEGDESSISYIHEQHLSIGDNVPVVYNRFFLSYGTIGVIRGNLLFVSIIYHGVISFVVFIIWLRLITWTMKQYFIHDNSLSKRKRKLL